MFRKTIVGVAAALTVMSGVSFGDDTELYLIESNVRVGKRPQVLFVFDNSGSMSTEDQNSSSSYCSPAEATAGTCTLDPNFVEFAESYSGYINDNAIYWNSGGIDGSSTMPTPENPTDSRRFFHENNNCNGAKKALASRGRYTGYMWERNKTGNTYAWEDLKENEGLNKNDIFDCWQDWNESDPSNPGSTYSTDGYPQNGAKDGYVSDRPATSPPLGRPVTLYTPHYLVWYKWATTTTDGQNSGGTGRVWRLPRKQCRMPWKT